MNRLSKLFLPTLSLPKNAAVKNQHEIASKSQRLMTDVGLIRSSGPGYYYILPLLQRSVEKLTSILDRHMKAIDGQKITMPTLTAAELWRKSGRLETAQTELLMVKDRLEKLQLLSPTHEESITSLISSVPPISYRSFPLRIYQVTQKFRDELRPKNGLIRAKEFLMKDLYTFDVDLEAARRTYEEVNERYSKIFEELKVPFLKIVADTGNMGGNVSHEYHILTSIGEDEVVICKDCSYAINKELCPDSKILCKNCQSSSVELHQGTEVGHTFILEDKYSKPLGATFLSKSGKPEYLQMGCYGIGVTRLIATCIEHLSTDYEIRWPLPLAPFKVCIIPPKEGSKEEKLIKHSQEEIYQLLESHESFIDDVIIDDRTSTTIGKRMRDAQKLGFPYVIVIGSTATEADPKVEVHDLNKKFSGNMSMTEAFSYLVNEINS